MVSYHSSNDFCMFEEILVKNVFNVVIKNNLKTQ